MKQFNAAPSLVCFFSKLVKTFRILNGLLVSIMIASLLLGMAAEPAEASDLRVYSNPNVFTALSDIAQTEFKTWILPILYQVGPNPRIGEFEQIVADARGKARYEEPEQLLRQTRQQAQAISPTISQSRAIYKLQSQNTVSLENAFQAAAKEFSIPVDLLKAASYAISFWEQRPGEASIEGGYGLMHLVRNQSVDRLGEAAKLIGVDAELLKTDPVLNIRAGAALLRYKAQEFGPALANATSIPELGVVLERWSGYPPDIAQIYLDNVFYLLRKGFSAKVSSGETLAIASQGNSLTTPNVNTAVLPVSATVPPVDYPEAIAYPTSKYNAGRSGSTVKYIVIGFGAGSITSLLNTYTSTGNPKSVHYAVGLSGGEYKAYQLVSEQDTANFLNPTNSPYNNTNFIGISLEGSFLDTLPRTQALYDRLRDMVQNIATRHGLIADCTTIIGQSTAAPGWGTNPLPNWDWNKVCNGPPPPPRRTVTSKNIGKPSYAQMRGEPVNTENGNFVYTTTDLSVPGNGSPLEFVRTYNSQDNETDGPFGFGWSFNLNTRLKLEADGSVKLTYPDGRGAKFSRNTDGSYTVEAGFFERLVKNGDGTFSLTRTDQIVMTFGADGKLTGQTDRNANRLSMKYDAAGNMSEVIDTGGRSYRLTYNSAGKITVLTDPTGRQVKYTYTTKQTLETVTDLKGATYRFAYTNDKRITSVTDGRGAIFITNQYDSEGWVAVQTDKDGKTFKFDYDATTTLYTDQVGNKTLFEYDDKHRPLKVTDALSGVEQYEYDANDNLITYTSPLGRKWRYTYDANGNRLTETDPQGRITKMEYDAQNNITRLVDARGGQYRYEYDLRGNLVKLTRPDSSVITTSYDNKGRLTSLTDPLGRVTRFSYDKAGNLKKVTNALGQINDFDYDEVGRVLAVEDALGRHTRNTYDAANNRLSVIDPLERIMKFEYDAENNLTGLTDRTGAHYSMTYNFNNQQLELTNPLGHTIKSRYNAALYLENQTGPGGGETHYEYDALHRVIGQRDALNRLTAYQYDADGNLTKQVKADGAVTTYQYDELNRVHCVVDTFSTSRCVEYDELGRMISAKDGRGNQTRYEYDVLGRLLKIIHPAPISGATRYDYDAAGNLTRQTDPLGRLTRTEYDKLNRPVKRIDPAGGETRYEYNAVGQLISMLDVRGLLTRYEYDPAGRLTRMLNPLDYITDIKYDAEDRPLEIIMEPLTRVTRYQYDAAGRVTKLTDPAGGVQLFEYDPSGNLTLRRSAAGRVTRLEYDLADQLGSMTDGLNRVSKMEYDLLGRLKKTIDPLGRVTEVAYDGLGRRIAIKDAKGGLTSFEYDVDSNLLAVKDPLNQTTRLAYDSRNRVTKLTDALGLAYDFSYDDADQLLSLKKPRGGVTSFKYDQLGRSVELKDALGALTKFEYDKAGNLLKTTNQRGFVEKREYDEINRMTKQIDRAGRVTNYRYNEASQLVELIDNPDRLTRFEYDNLGRMTEMTDALGGSQQFRYDPDGLVLDQTDALGRVTKAEYDGAGQLMRSLSPRGAETKLEYDGAGNVTALIDPMGQRYGFGYDALNQLVSQIDPLGRRTETTRDNLSRQTATKNPRGFVTGYTYDVLNRVKSVGDAKGAVSNYAYDEDGNLASFKDSKGGLESWQYDLEGRPTAYTNQLNKIWNFEYDPAGNRSRSRDANGTVLNYQYDGMDRLTRLEYPDSTAQQRKYDRFGNLTELVDQTGTSRFSYDLLNRMTSEKRDNRLTSAEYDKAGNLTRMEFPNGQSQRREYDADNWLKKIVDQRDEEYIFTRDLLGRQTELLYPNGAKTRQTFDAAGQLTALTNLLPGDQLLNRYEYTLDPNGNRTQVKTRLENKATALPEDDDVYGYKPKVPLPKKSRPASNPYGLDNNFASVSTTTDYSYDELDRLGSEKQSTGLNVNYAMDANGNLTRRQVSHSQKAGQQFNFDQQFSYDAANHLTGLSSVNGAISFGYDPNGNRTLKNDGTTETRYKYDFEDRLSGVETTKVGGNPNPDLRPRLGVSEYAYDGLGRLQSTYVDKKGQSKNSKDADVTKLYWGLQLVGEEYDGSRKSLDDLYYTVGDGGSVLGSVSHERRARNTSQYSGRQHSAHYFQHDGLGSPVAVTNQYGRVVGSQTFSSYGEQHDDQQLDKLPNLGFTGQDYDDASGLTHFYARWYDPETTRWLGDDPYRGRVGDPTSHNRSLYVKSNPVNLVDPMGYFSLPLLANIFMPIMIPIVAVASIMAPVIIPIIAPIIIPVVNRLISDLSRTVSSLIANSVSVLDDYINIPGPEYSPNSRSYGGTNFGSTPKSNSNKWWQRQLNINNITRYFGNTLFNSLNKFWSNSRLCYALPQNNKPSFWRNVGEFGTSFVKRSLDTELTFLYTMSNPIPTIYNIGRQMSNAYNQYGGGFDGVIMAANQLNPAYLAIDSGIKTKEAIDRGDWRGVGAYGFDTLFNTVSTLVLAIDGAGIVLKGASAVVKDAAITSVTQRLPWKIITEKKLRQMSTRGWSEADIQAVLDNPSFTLTTIDKRPNIRNNATVYYRKDGYYIIRNDNTQEIIQFSDRKDLQWYDDNRNSKVRPVP